MIGRREEESRAWHIARLVTVVVCLMAGTAATTLAVVQFARPERTQPLTITACAPDTYEFPDPIDGGPMYERGVRQDGCVRQFAAPDDQWPITEPVRVVGQVCLDNDTSVAYQVSIAYESVDTPDLRITVLDVPITYDPGCQPPYDFPFEFPLQSLTLETSEPGESLGQWRIVGRAVPGNTDRYLPSQWDSTSTVELVAP